MSNISPATRATGNLFLDHLPDKALQAVLPLLKQEALKHGERIYDRDQSFAKVIFPVASILSVVMDMTDGSTAEVGIIGREGMTGLPLALGVPVSNQRIIVQVPNGAEYLDAEDFRTALEDEPELKSFALRYAQATLTGTSQLSACNSLHPTNERCARWLLMAHDRVDDDLLLLTQEFLSQMLGVRRGAVTLAASALQEAGFISYARGHINVRNRAGLESASCECYETMDRDWKGVMGYSIRKAPASFKVPPRETRRPDGPQTQDS